MFFVVKDRISSLSLVCVFVTQKKQIRIQREREREMALFGNEESEEKRKEILVT